MKDGKVFWSGTYQEIIKEEFFEEFVKSIETKKKSGEIEEKEENKNNNMDEENDNIDEEESSKSNILAFDKKKLAEKEKKIKYHLKHY